MEIRISEPLKSDEFQVCLASFVSFEVKWSEVHSAARNLVQKCPWAMFSPEIRANFAFPGNRIWILRDYQSLSNEDANLALETRLQYLGLRQGNYFRPNEEILQHCIRFSIQVRLGPDWSRLGPFLVHDSDFLSKNRLEIVRPELRVANKGVCLATEAKILRWYRLDLVDLEIDADVRSQFDRKVLNTIPRQRIATSYLIVLPNMTRGRIHSISRHLLSSLAIKNYSDMRLYWRNVHGYELAEEEPKFYCNVHFQDDLSASGLFCYPEICVRTLEPFPISTPENIKQGIVKTFLQTLQIKVPSICHQKFSFPNSDIAMEPVVDLFSARQEHSGLQKKVPASERPSTSFRWASMGPGGDSNPGPQIFRNETPLDSNWERKEIRIQNSFSSLDNDLAEIEQHSPGQKLALVNDNGYSTDAPAHTPANSITYTPASSSSQALARVYATPTVATRPFIPCFKAAVTARPASSWTATRGLFPTSQPLKPTFTPQATKTSLMPITTATLSTPGWNETTISTASRVPSFGPSFSKSAPSQQKPQTPVPYEVLPPVRPELMKPLFSMPKPVFTQKTKPVAAPKPKHPPKPRAPPKPKPLKEATGKRKSEENSQATTTSSILTSSLDALPAMTAPAAPKRPKTVIRTDLDIPTMAATPGGLSKVNVATLYDWCKKNGVVCKAKDKKDELVNKVLIKLNLFVPIEP